MEERPIFFTAPMILAILDGRKSQTKRVVKTRPENNTRIGTKGHQAHIGSPEALAHCPYGQPGSVLWVREGFARCPEPYNPNGIIYRADGEDDHVASLEWCPSIHMPRWASRITLEIVSVRVERVQEISEADAIAEGIERQIAHGEDLGWKNYLWHGDFGANGNGNKQTDEWPWQYSTYQNARDCFSSLWHLIYAKRGYGWTLNPFVWVIEFKRISQPSTCNLKPETTK